VRRHLIGLQHSPGSSDAQLRRVVLASFIGTTIEWYDFFLYGTAAALVFNKLFFPTLEPLAGTLSSYGTFAVGFVARPLGGIVFGHFGDRIGRKQMLVWSLLVMGIATALIGLTPTYSQIGIWAPVLLVTLRFIQGFGVGGEWGGAVLLAVEHSGGDRRGFHGSWPQMGVPGGLLLSTAVFAMLSARLPEPAFLAWGWRVPFLLSVILVAVGLFIRLRVLESPSFEKVKEAQRESKVPLLDGDRAREHAILVVSVRSCRTTASVSRGECDLAVVRVSVLLAVAAWHRLRSDCASAGHEHWTRHDVWAHGSDILGAVRNAR
jgi:MFS transporter, MHS family, shikimate and dehydroshikimate transport protein